MRRDDEIKRLTKYAEAMGLKVSFSSDKKSGAAAMWNLDGSEITIFLWEHDSKTQIVLSMIHEIAHHLWWIHEKNRKPDRKFEEAIEFECYREAGHKPIHKRYRKRIYDMELASTAYWEAIYKETDVRVPLWKLHMHMDFDVWQYEVYWQEGKFPKISRNKDKFREFKAKHSPLAKEKVTNG